MLTLPGGTTATTVDQTRSLTPWTILPDVAVSSLIVVSGRLEAPLRHLL